MFYKNHKIIKNLGIFFIISLSFFISLKAEALVLNNKPDDNYSTTNGKVFSMVKDSEGDLYLGGDFSEIVDSADITGALAVMDKDSGSPLPSSLKVNSAVFSSISDGQGGLYIGGMFTSVSDQKRNCLAHIKADGTLDSDFKPNITGGQGSVRTIILLGSDLYIGGNFTSIDGQVRNYFAKMNTSGVLDSDFAPSFSGPVYSMVLLDSNFYVGGNFTTVNSLTRNHLAKLDTSGNIDSSFAPSFNKDIDSVVVYGSDLYVGGTFTTANSLTRNRLAKLNTSGVIDPSFSPSFNGSIWTMTFLGSDLYVGGAFETVNSLTRNHLAKLDTSGNLNPSFVPNFNDDVWSFFPSGNNLYVGGSFTAIDISTRNRLAKLDTSGNIDPSFAPYVNGDVNSFFLFGSNLYVGGKFNAYVPGQTRNNLAKFKADGTLDSSFTPNFNGNIRSMAISGSSLYVGGNFTTVNSLTRNHLAKLDTSGAVDSSFSPSFNGSIWAMTFLDSNLYVGGTFTTANSLAHNRLAKLDTSGNINSSFAPSFSGPVYSMVLLDSNFYVGGNFTTVNSLTHNYLAKLDMSGNIDSSFAPSFDATVSTIAISGSSLYVGGNFTTVNSLTRNHLAKLDTSGNVNDSFSPIFANYVSSITLSGNDIYATGNFLAVNSLERNYIAKLNTDGDLDSIFQPVMGGYGSSVFLFDNVLYVGNSHTPGPFRFSPDTTSPTITLIGSSPIILTQGETYTDAGAIATDTNDGNLTSSIVVVNPVNTSLIGTYTVSYNVSDTAGNAATTVTRTVKVVSGPSLPTSFTQTPEQILSATGQGTGSFNTLTLNNNIPFTTTNRKVSLTFDNLDNPLITRLAISPDSDFTNDSLINYTPVYEYDLCGTATSCPDGKYTVYARYYTIYGQHSQTISLDITLKQGTSASVPETITNDVSRLSGRILLQVESHGEAWYINPGDQKRYYLKDGAAAYQLMRSFGLGITNADLEKISTANNQTTGDTKLATRLKGHILLQVENHGEAWYVDPQDGRRYYMANGTAAYELMRSHSLGITNENLEKIGAGKL